MKKRLLISAAVVAATLLLAVAGFAVLVQQYNAWSYADLERNVSEFNDTDTLDDCMSEIDGVWLPWLRAEAETMCGRATHRN